MITAIRTIALLVAMLGPTVAHAACPASVKVGTPDQALDIGPDLKDDAEFAKMHLVHIGRALSASRESCQQGVAENCRLANFLAEAKAGLECYAGTSSQSAGQLSAGVSPAQGSTPSTASQMHSGSARDIGSNPRGSRQAATMESCKCGSDYIPCWIRNAKRSGERYQVSADGRHIVFFARDGTWSGKKGWNGGNSCSAVVS